MFYQAKTYEEAIAIAAAKGRFILYGNYSGPLYELVEKGHFNRLKHDEDFIFATDDPRLVGHEIRISVPGRELLFSSGPLVAFSELKRMSFTSAIIMDSVDCHRRFDEILDLGIVSSNRIYLPPSAWDDRACRDDGLLAAGLEKAKAEVQGEGLSSEELASHIIDCLSFIKRNGIPGDIVNLGVYRGWSAQFIAEIRDRVGLSDRSVWCFDTFNGFVRNAASHYDSFIEFMETSYGIGGTVHTDTSIEYVRNRLSPYKNIELIQGNISETIGVMSGRRIAFALFDMDDYTPTSVALDPVYSSLSHGGFIVHDHYSYPSCARGGVYGQRKAMREFMKTHRMFNLSGTNVFQKIESDPAPALEYPSSASDVSSIVHRWEREYSERMASLGIPYAGVSPMFHAEKLAWIRDCSGKFEWINSQSADKDCSILKTFEALWMQKRFPPSVVVEKIRMEFRLRSGNCSILLCGFGKNGRELLSWLREDPELSQAKILLWDDRFKSSPVSGVALAKPREWASWPEGVLAVLTPADSRSMLSVLRDKGADMVRDILPSLAPDEPQGLK